MSSFQTVEGPRWSRGSAKSLWPRPCCSSVFSSGLLFRKVRIIIAHPPGTLVRVPEILQGELWAQSLVLTQRELGREAWPSVSPTVKGEGRPHLMAPHSESSGCSVLSLWGSELLPHQPALPQAALTDGSVRLWGEETAASNSLPKALPLGARLSGTQVTSSSLCLSV